MRGFHTTYMDNLDSILESGIQPRITTENNFPMAWDNRHREAVFFMTDIESAYYWYRVHHPKDWTADENGYAIPMERGESVIIEFETDAEVFCDPYSNEPSLMKNARYIEVPITPDQIIDIHEGR